MADKVSFKKGNVTAEVYTTSAVDEQLKNKVNKYNPVLENVCVGNHLYFPSNIDCGAPLLNNAQNCLAFLLDRGGTCECTDLTTGEKISNLDGWGVLFDGSPLFAYLDESWTNDHTYQFIIKLPNYYHWTIDIYVDFAFPIGAPKHCIIEGGYSKNNVGSASNPDSDIKWKTCNDGTPYNGLFWGSYGNYDITSSNAINYIRITLDKWFQNEKRICQIGLISSENINKGFHNSCLSLGGGDMYGDILMQGSNKISFYNPNNLNVPQSIYHGSGDGGSWLDGDGKDNLVISSWYSIGFHDNCFNRDNISMNLRDGIFRAKILQGADSGKQIAIDDIASASEVKSVREIAEGKTKTIAIDSSSNVNGSSNALFNYSKSSAVDKLLAKVSDGAIFITDVTGKNYTVPTDFKKGDLVFTTPKNIKDWWYAGVVNVDNIDYYAFYVLDADTPDLANYATKSDVSSLKDELGDASKKSVTDSIDDSTSLPVSSAVKKYVDDVSTKTNEVINVLIGNIESGTSNGKTKIFSKEGHFVEKQIVYGLNDCAYRPVLDSALPSLITNAIKLKIPSVGALIGTFYTKTDVDTLLAKKKETWRPIQIDGTDIGDSSLNFSTGDYGLFYSTYKGGNFSFGTNMQYTNVDFDVGADTPQWQTRPIPNYAMGLVSKNSDGQEDKKYSLIEILALINAKQDALVSGVNIKTVNGVPIVGEGNATIPTSLPSAGTMSSLSLTDRLNLQNAPLGIQFSSANYQVTNMEAGEVSITLETAVNNDASASVTFHGGSKGSGTWRIALAVTGSTWVTSVTATAESVTNSGFRIWARRLVDTSSNTASKSVTVSWIAVKYY